MPQISIIIPNYNHARFLRQRIDTVLAQTHRDFELIILDDCSRDDSRAIIEEYRNREQVAHIVFNEQNSGSAFQQWKKGIALAKNEWIWIAESDDYCDEDLLASLVANAEKNDEVVVSFCQSYYREDGNPVVQDMGFYTDPLDLHHWRADYCNAGTDEIRRFLLYRNTIPNASAVLFKKSAYLQIDKAFEQMKQCGDWLMWVQLLKRGNVAFCARPLNNFRAHGATTRFLDTLAKRRTRLEEEYAVVSDIKRTVDHNDPVAVEARLRGLVADYARCFTKRDILKFVAWPFAYQGKIPYAELLIGKIKWRLGA